MTYYVICICQSLLRTIGKNFTDQSVHVPIGRRWTNCQVRKPNKQFQNAWAVSRTIRLGELSDKMSSVVWSRPKSRSDQIGTETR